MMRKLILATFLFTLGTGQATAQDDDREERVRELRNRIRELSEELRQLEGERRNMFFNVNPGEPLDIRMTPLTIFAGGNARMGIVVQTRADEAVDSIGALVQSVDEGSAAWEAGIREGDVITRFDGETLTGRYPAAGDYEAEPAIKLIDLVREHEAGDTVEVLYRRGSESRSTEVVLESAANVFSLRLDCEDGDCERRENVWSHLIVPSPDGPERFDPNVARIRMIGSVFDDLELVSLNEELGRYFGVDEGVLVIRGDENLGLQGGDVIVRIGAREVDDPSRVFRILGSYEPGEEIAFDIVREDERITVEGSIRESSSGVFRRRRRPDN